VRTLYRDSALADGRSPELRLGVSLLVDDGRIVWIRPTDDEEDPAGAEVIDSRGACIVPGMVDCHSHLTLPGGSHWLERAADPPEVMLRVGEENARLLMAAGIRWARDVGAPRGIDPIDGKERALSLGLRDRWRGRREFPYVRAAGAWLAGAGMQPLGLMVEARSADELLAAALRQLDDGADFVKLYMEGPDPETPPWTAAELRQVVEAVHARGALATAHSTRYKGTRVCAEAGVDCVEHGFEVDAETARLMADKGVAMVSTLTAIKSWRTGARTIGIERFTREESKTRIAARWEGAVQAVRTCREAGVLIAAGTDFGGGPARANQLAWEVEALVEAGLEPWEALAAATWRGGQVLGEPEAGIIREDGPADFFMVHGDPLSDPAALWRVWKVVV